METAETSEGPIETYWISTIYTLTEMDEYTWHSRMGASVIVRRKKTRSLKILEAAGASCVISQVAQVCMNRSAIYQNFENNGGP